MVPQEPISVKNSKSTSSPNFSLLAWKVTMSGVFCTNNAQAPSLFSNVTLTSRRTKLIVPTSCVCLLVLRWKRGRELVHCLYKNSRHVYQPPSARKPYLESYKKKLNNKIKSCRQSVCQSCTKTRKWKKIKTQNQKFQASTTKNQKTPTEKIKVQNQKL